MYFQRTHLHVLLTETLQLLKLLLHLLLMLRHQVLLLDLILLIRQTLYVRLDLAQAIIHSTNIQKHFAYAHNLVIKAPTHLATRD